MAVRAAPSRADRLQDRVSRGLGRAGLAIGASCEVYRPSTTSEPLESGNLVLRLHAAFAPPEPNWAKPVGYGQAIWHGLFDAAYTRPGDYLVRRESRDGAGDGGVWFIAAQQYLLPVLCVRASRVITITRPAGAQSVGVNGYGGILADVAATLLHGFPASVLDGGGGGRFQADLPTTTGLGAWTVLLPPIAGLALKTGDRIADDLGRTGVIAAVELSELGWRLNVTQAAT
jgi:hypothetical protein